jgi:hypothetical protein
MKFCIFLIFFLLFSVQASFSQSSEIDSLLRILKTLPKDTTKVKIFNEVSRLYDNSDGEKAKSFAIKALELAQKLQYKKGIGDSWYSLNPLFFQL